MSQILSLVLLGSPGIVFAQALLAHNKERELYVIRISVLIAKVLSLATLIPFYGLWGAIIAILTGKLVEVLLLAYFFYADASTEVT